MTRFDFNNYRTRASRWLRQPIAQQMTVAEFRDAVRRRDFVRLRWPAEILLWIVAVATLGYCTAQYSAAAIHQSHQSARFEALRSVQRLLHGDSDSGTVAVSAGAVLPKNEPLGRIEIPSAGVSAIVEEGVTDNVLGESVGHIPGTALPGQPGNAALAAHRDTYFRNLADVKSGDEVWFTTATTIHKYRVESTSIVEPSDLSVLASDNGQQLTLITCYPFHFIGPAPKRFVVVARAEGSPPN